MTETPPFVGLVLAGGEGRRWGGPKAWARLPDGRSFLEACAATLQEAGATTVAATLPPGSAADDAPGGVLAVPLERAGLDMFASIRAGLGRLADQPGWRAAVLLPVDHPLVRPGTVRALLSAGPPAALPQLAGRHGHPVCLWRELADEVASGRHPGPTLREVLASVATRDVPVDDPGVRANCNTPEALQRALAAQAASTAEGVEGRRSED